MIGTRNYLDSSSVGVRCAKDSRSGSALIGLLWLVIMVGCSENAASNDSEPFTANPKVDHHLHLVSPRIVEVSRGPALSPIEVPPHITRVLQERANAWNDAGTLAQLYTPDAKIIVDQWYRISGIFQGAEAVADHLSKRFGRPYELTPVAFHTAENLGYLVGYYSRGNPPSQSRFGYFTMSLVKDGNAQWRIAAESPSFAREQPLSPVDAEQLVAMLDAAGIERGVIHSAAVVFGGQWVDIYRAQQTVQERQALVQAENDWNAAQAALYPERLLSFCSFHLLDPFALDEIRRCKATGHAGLKLHFDVDGTDFLNPIHRAQARSVFSAANQLDMPVMAHVQNNEGSAEDTLTRYRFFLDEVLSAAPDIPVQIAHLWGGGDFSEGGLEAFADLVESGHPSTRNLYFDLGDVPRVILQYEPDKAQAIALMVVEQIRRIGVERIVFGSDGGMEGFQSPGEAWQALVEHFPFTPAELAKIANNVAPYI